MHSKSIPSVVHMSRNTPSSGGSDGSSSNFELPPEHFTRQRQMPSFEVIMTQRVPSQPHANRKRIITSPPIPSSESESSDFNLPQEHFMRERLMPSLEVLKAMQNMTIRKAPTTPRRVSSSDDLHHNSRSCASWKQPEFSDSASTSPFEPPSPGITFHGNPRGPEAEPNWRGEK